MTHADDISQLLSYGATKQHGERANELVGVSPNVLKRQSTNLCGALGCGSDDQPRKMGVVWRLAELSLAIAAVVTTGGALRVAGARGGGRDVGLRSHDLETHTTSAAAAPPPAPPSADAPVQSSSSSSSHVAPAHGLLLSSEYERRSGRRVADGLLPFFVAEVHRPTRIALANASRVLWRVEEAADEALDDDGASSADDGSGGAARAAARGADAAAPRRLVYASAAPESEIEVTLVRLGKHVVTATRSGGDSSGDSDSSFEVSARLVRRELRSLTTTDRERFLGALHTVYSVDQTEGVAMYGSNYKSAAWLIREHLYGAADAACDHWHDDAGILNHHVGITWQLEQSLHAVDGGVAAHYWDYTIDATASGPDTRWWQSELFDDDWFGAVETGRADHVVAAGRWAYTPVLAHARGFSNITNPYGLLRSPWNTNPTPYLTRNRYTLGLLGDGYAHFPTCANFSTYLYSESLGQMLFGLNGFLHGPVHIMVGGHWSFNGSKWNDLDEVRSVPCHLSHVTFDHVCMRSPHLESRETHIRKTSCAFTECR